MTGKPHFINDDLYDEMLKRSGCEFGASMNTILRVYLEMPVPAPKGRPRVTIDKRKKYNIMHLVVGESVKFSWEWNKEGSKDIYSRVMRASVWRQVNSTGRTFDVENRGAGMLVTRLT